MSKDPSSRSFAISRKHLAFHLFDICTAPTDISSKLTQLKCLEFTAVKVDSSTPAELPMPYDTVSKDAIVLVCSRSTVINLPSVYNCLGVLLESCGDNDDVPDIMPRVAFQETFPPHQQPTFVPLVRLHPGYRLSEDWDRYGIIFAERLLSSSS